MELIAAIVSLIVLLIILVSVYGTHQETKKLVKIQQHRLTLGILIATGQSTGRNYAKFLADDGAITAAQRELINKALDNQ